MQHWSAFFKRTISRSVSKYITVQTTALPDGEGVPVYPPCVGDVGAVLLILILLVADRAIKRSSGSAF